MFWVFIPKYDAKMVIAIGASSHSLEEKKFITQRKLDEASPDKTLIMIKYDGHTCVVNTKIMEILKDKVNDFRGYHENIGETNHEVFFKFSNYSSSVAPVKLLRNMQIAADYHWSDSQRHCQNT